MFTISAEGVHVFRNTQDGQQIVFAQYLDKTDQDLDLINIPKHDSVGLTAKELIRQELISHFPELSR